jgi:hypothetical protein
MDLLKGHTPALGGRDLLAESFFEDGPEGSAAARGRFRVEDGPFAAVLVGRDGGEKHRSTEPVVPEGLFEVIDAMPMRRREMREKGAG